MCDMMMLLVLLVDFSSAINYCHPSKEHGLCGVDCMSFPKLCKEKKKTNKDGVYDGRHRQIFFSNQSIIRVMESLNEMRSQAMGNSLKYKFGGRMHTLPKPSMFYTMVMISPSPILTDMSPC